MFCELQREDQSEAWMGGQTRKMETGVHWYPRTRRGRLTHSGWYLLWDPAGFLRIQRRGHADNVAKLLRRLSTL